MEVSMFIPMKQLNVDQEELSLKDVLLNAAKLIIYASRSNLTICVPLKVHRLMLGRY